MAIPTQIETTTETIRDAVRSRCYIAERLGGKWEEIDGLHCDELRLAAAPTIDTCLLSYEYGDIRREDGTQFERFERLEKLGQYVKVVLEGATPDDEDVTWYGVLEVDSTVPFGSGPTEDEYAGRQQLTAYGLLRLLERVYVLKSWVDWSQNSDIPYKPVLVEYGLRFNKRDRKLTARKGNRSAKREEDNPTKSYVFSESLTSNDLWTIGQAVEYLLQHHAPTDGNGDPLCTWALADREGLDWDTPVLETDGRTVKQCLDALISRRRGFSYVLEYDESSGTNGTITLRAFSFASDEITMPAIVVNGEEVEQRIAANESQYRLNFEQALDVDVRIVDAIVDSYDAVVAIGAFATSTFTLAWGYQANNYGALWQITPDWSDAQYTDYLTGPVPNTGFPLDKQQRATRYRNSPALRPVFRRWKVYPWWDGTVWNYEGDESVASKYVINPLWPNKDRDTDPEAEPDATYNPLNNNTDRTPPEIWPQGIQWEAHLPLLDRCDYSDTNIQTGDWDDTLTDGVEPLFRPFLFYVRTDQTAPYKYELLERLSDQSSNELQRRRWSVSATVLHDRPGFELQVSGGPQHFLAAHIGNAVQETEAFLTGSKEGALSWYAIRSTVCARLPWRVQQRVDVRDEIVAGRQERILYLPVDARLDYVVPDTVVSLDNGSPVTSTGGFVRDDRKHLAAVAQAAAQWYRAERQTLQFRLTGVLQVVPIGALITEVGGQYQLEGINTVVTGMRFDLRSQATEWETSFAEIEFT